jgi:hypothetical protein
MGGTQAAKVLAQIEASSFIEEKWEAEVDEAKEAIQDKSQIRRTGFSFTMLLQIVDRCDYRSLWTRELDISMGIEAANHSIEKN